MKEIIAILALVALVCLGGYMAAEALDSAAAGWATGQMYQMQRDVSIAQIEATTQIRLRELQMLEDAMTRSLLAVLFWPVAALIGLLLAGGVWFAVWRESRRPRHYLSGAEWQQPALSQNDWQPAARARARRQAEYEWSTMAGEAAYWERQR